MFSFRPKRTLPSPETKKEFQKWFEQFLVAIKGAQELGPEAPRIDQSNFQKTDESVQKFEADSEVALSKAHSAALSAISLLHQACQKWTEANAIFNEFSQGYIEWIKVIENLQEINAISRGANPTAKSNLAKVRDLFRQNRQLSGDSDSKCSEALKKLDQWIDLDSLVVDQQILNKG